MQHQAVSLEATFKTRDVEGVVDLYFYRPLAFHLARFFARLKMTPVGVTLLGGLFGIVGGHLYFYRDLRLNVIGMFLHVCANLLDNADGQLARLINQKSRRGRIIDSLVDHFIFLNIYIHLTLRLLVEGASPRVLVLALAAALSHAFQAAAADYFRNGYLYFVKGRSRADWDSCAGLLNDYRKLSWRTDAWNKFLLATYLSFTKQQEFFSPVLRRLQEFAGRNFGDEVSDNLRDRYRNFARPMLRGWGFLMTNTRMFFLFLFLFIKQPVWFFWFEATVLNLLFAFLIWHQERMARFFLAWREPVVEIATALH